MKTARRILTNFLSLTTAEMISKLIQLIIFIYIARSFGKSEFGKFGFALAFSTIIVVITDFGINTLLIREISRDKKNVDKFVSNALTLKVALSIVTLIVSFLYFNFVKYDYATKNITYFMILFMVLQSFTDTFYSVFRAFEKMHYDAIMKVVRMLMLIFLVYFFISQSQNLVFITLMFPITEVIILIASMIIYTRNFSKLSLGFNFGFEKELIKKSAFFCLSIIFGTVILYIDTIMLEGIRGPEEVGIYSAAYNLLLGVTFIPLMFSNAIYPVFSRYFVRDRELLRFAYKKSFQYMLIIGLPITAGIFIYSRNIVLLAYGIEYAKSIIVIKILCWFILLRFINIVSGTLLSSADRQGARVFGQGTVALVNIILNLILIPKYGFIGAGIATIASESFFFVTYYYFIFKEKLNIDYFVVSAKPLIASIVMLLAISFVPDLLIGSILGAFSYIGMLLLLKAFKNEDKELLTRILRNY